MLPMRLVRLFARAEVCAVPTETCPSLLGAALIFVVFATGMAGSLVRRWDKASASIEVVAFWCLGGCGFSFPVGVALVCLIKSE